MACLTIVVCIYLCSDIAQLNKTATYIYIIIQKDISMIVDEVQTGLGPTGTMW